MKTPRLILVGLAMAAVAALLTIFAQSMLEGDAGLPRRTGQAELVVAARALPVGYRLTAEDLTTAPSPGVNTARNAFASPTSLIGRTAIVSLAQGQIIREEDLAARGSGPAIASQLPPGFRAITVTLRDAGPEVVLYPGALVDVLATVDSTGRSGARESMTRTLVEGVRIVAVNDEAVGGRTADPIDRRTVTRKPNITLAVTPEQAAQVELASSKGSIGITLRSSADSTDGAGPGAVATTQSLLGLSAETPVAPAAKPAPEPKDTAERPVEKPTPAAPVAPPEKPKTWEVKVLRGKDSSTHSFPGKS